ncbi:MAG: hypothetical protein JXM70_01905 [Pirellulales bacterium]|nr:hypothetical protein [Pirellulales bacterium]
MRRNAKVYLFLALLWVGSIGCCLPILMSLGHQILQSWHEDNTLLSVQDCWHAEEGVLLKVEAKSSITRVISEDLYPFYHLVDLPFRALRTGTSDTYIVLVELELALGNEASLELYSADGHHCFFSTYYVEAQVDDAAWEELWNRDANAIIEIGDSLKHGGARG